MKAKFNKRRMIATAIAASSLALLTGCGQNPPPPAPAPAPGPGAPGLIGGCVPINTTTMIPFTVNGMYIGSEAAGDMRVLAGPIPPGDQLSPGQTHGQMMLQGGGVMPPQQYSIATFQGRRVDGTSITLTVNSPVGGAPVQQYPTQYPNQYPQQNYISPTGQYNATGYIQVSSFLQQLLIQTAMGTNTQYGFGSPLLNQMPGQYPTQYPGQYPQVNMQQICVSNLGISLRRTLSSYANWLYMGDVYFYLSGGMNNTGGMHGLAVSF